MMSDESQLNSSDITSQRVGDFEHRLLWNSDESTQVICPTELSYDQCGSCQLPDQGLESEPGFEARGWPAAWPSFLAHITQLLILYSISVCFHTPK